MPMVSATGAKSTERGSGPRIVGPTVARSIIVSVQTDERTMQQDARRFDGFVLLWFIAALAVYALHGFQSGLSRDSAFYVYAGQEVAAGAAPYVEQMNRAGPLAHLLPGLGVLLAGWLDIGDVYGIRVVYWVISALGTALVYRVGAAAFTSRNAGHVSAAAMLSFLGFAAFATSGPQSKTPIVLFLAWALLLLIQRRWLTAGIVTALATLTWQPVLFAIAPGALLACLFALGGGRERLAALLRYAIGGLLTLLAVSAYFLAMRALPEFLDGFLLANIQYTEQGGIAGDAGEAWSLVLEGYRWSSWVLVIGMVLLVLAGLFALIPRHQARDRWVRQSTLVLLATLIGGSLWSYRAFNGWADAFVVLPLAALGFGALMGQLSRGWAAVPATLMTLVCVVASVAATSWSMWDTRSEVILDQELATEAVFSRLPADATAVTSQAPHALALSGVRNISRYQLFTNGMDAYIDANWDGGLEGYAEWIVEQNPTVLTVNGDGMPTWFADVVKPEFDYVGRAPGFFVYVNTSVDADTRAAISAELDEVPIPEE